MGVSSIDHSGMTTFIRFALISSQQLETGRSATPAPCTTRAFTALTLFERNLLSGSKVVLDAPDFNRQLRMAGLGTKTRQSCFFRSPGSWRGGERLIYKGLATN